MPEKNTLNVSNFNEVVIHPWKEELEMVIECNLDKNRPYNDSSIRFHRILELKILSLHFSSCNLQYGYEMNSKTERSVSISKCVFEKSAVAINSTESNLNFTVSNCTFSSDRKGVLSIHTPYYAQENVIRYITIAHLQITDTLFYDVSENDIFDFAGTLQVTYTNLTIGNCRFVNNSATNYFGFSNGAISALSSTVTIYSTTFQQGVSMFGSAVSLYRSSGMFDSCHFVNNSATLGTVYVQDSQLSISNSVFKYNIGTALYISGGSLDVTISNCTFRNNLAQAGGALYAKQYQGYITIANSSFGFNRAVHDGGALYCEGSFIDIQDLVYSFSNSAEKGNGGFVFLSKCNIYINSYHVSNRASNGGVIYAEHGSNIFVESNTTMTNNTADKNGGALYLKDSNIFFGSDEPGMRMLLSNNVAKQQGGAIYVPDTDCETRCFLHEYGVTREQVAIIFMNNTAPQGPILYGGLLDRCYSNTTTLGIDYLKAISNFEHTPKAITSNPVRMCLCTEDHELDCTTRNLTVSNKVRGQTINLLGIVVDQDKNPKVSHIRADYSETTAELGKGEGRRETGNTCNELSYHIFTRNNSATLVLQPEGGCEFSNFSSVKIDIKIKPCPQGFENHNDRCECDKRLSSRFDDLVCDVDAGTILTEISVIWVRYDEHYLKLHANCPLNYCLATSFTYSLEFPDEQCDSNRSGVICGACRDNYSIGLGGSKCLQCTSNYPLIWLIPVFAVAGVALVALLLVCNMTISHGTLNGLIFYANIISITRLTSLQNCSIHPILSVFIAWVNLDFGIETCFYSGMTTYHKTWLQFAFPLYIWLLVGAIILVSRYSYTAVKVFGRNNIAVLATIFLLSYSKILTTIITALNLTQVLQGSANATSDKLEPYNVWTHDGNIEYLKGKHVPLFAVALVLLVFLFLPYTLLLMLGQCIRSMSTKRRCILWFLRSAAFISIMDAYHAPYSNRHRYWTGLLLLSRCVLFLAVASKYSDNALLATMFITTLVCIGILSIKTCSTKVYKNALINILEICFLLNLLILSGTVHYLRGIGAHNTLDICTCTNASISMSLVMFAGILTYHTYLQLNKTRCFRSIKGHVLTNRRRKNDQLQADREEKDIPPIQSLPTTMVVELREELLSDQY